MFRKVSILVLFFVLIVTSFYIINKKPTKESLRVFTYSSFAGSWGPGPMIASEFEKKYGVRVEFIDVGDAGLIIQRALLEKDKEGVDVILGLDQFSRFEAEAKIGFRGKLIAYDWAPLSIVTYNKELAAQTTSLDDLLLEGFRKNISIQDPRTSSPGLLFFLWVLADKGIDEGFVFLQKLLTNVHSVSSSWDNSYGLFQKGVVQSTVSYLTSPIYHLVEEKKENVFNIVMSVGHPVQYEYVGAPLFCRHCDKAEDFMKFLMSPEIQKIIMEKNYMLPTMSQVKVGTPFANLPEVRIISEDKLLSLYKQKETLLTKWVQLRMKM